VTARSTSGQVNVRTTPRGARPRWGTEQIAVRDHVGQRLMHVRPVVDEMRDTQFPAVHRLVRPAAAEAQVASRDAGPRREIVMLEPQPASG
jgi:hypothetical protein